MTQALLGFNPPVTVAPWTCACGKTGGAATAATAVDQVAAHYQADHHRTLNTTALRLAVTGHAL